MLCSGETGVVPRVCRAERPETACNRDKNPGGFATVTILGCVCKLLGKYSPLCAVHIEICGSSQCRVSSFTAPCLSTAVDCSLGPVRRIPRMQLSSGSDMSIGFSVCEGIYRSMSLQLVDAC